MWKTLICLAVLLVDANHSIRQDVVLHLWAREWNEYQESAFFSKQVYALYENKLFIFVFKTGSLDTVQTVINPFSCPIP